MKDSVIRPGDRVVVIRMVRGYDRGTYYATVVRWTDGGRITVLSDNVRKGGKSGFTR
ncbi:hypothetical protein [Spirosoma oryzicola]|uniref:hypothetical protein n=1 Tax=Spirosoma oryzicola TaxID=2898794 RepID=UPI001E2C2DB0|nr:hypothetical protein [Spirosoma oryzicola]UHG93464.1 hypothetical protein LQ777_11280 [Spirosoma oryzicola]